MKTKDSKTSENPQAAGLKRLSEEMNDLLQVIETLRDNGVGFDMRYADKLFNIFQRLHSERILRAPGLDLHWLRRIVERHGGKVCAESSPGKGAVFYFSLPREQAHAE